MKVCALIVGVAACGLSVGAQAKTTNISLGQSAQNYVLFGQGPVAEGVGSFTNQQGSEVYDAIANTTTDSLTGLITASTNAGYASGSYDFVTTYSGTPIGMGGTEIRSQSNPANLNYFFYSSLDPSVSMTLYLTGTPTGDHAINLFGNGNFLADFSFGYVTASCLGVASCGQNNVGLTRGASQFGPVTISVAFDTPVAGVPEPGTWALMLAGFAGVGVGLRRRRRTLAIA